MKKTTMVCLLAVLPTAIFAAQKAATPAPAARMAAPPPVLAPAPAVIDVEKTRLTKDQFDKLPDSQVLEFRGQRSTVGDLRAKVKIFLARRAAGKIKSISLKTNFETIRKEFLAHQRARIESRNAQVLAEFQRLKVQNVVVAPH